MTRPLRIAQVAPVAHVGAAAALGLDRDDDGAARPTASWPRGHDVTLFATGASRTPARAARDVRARLPRRSDALAVGAVRAVQPGRRGRAASARSTSSTTRPSTSPMSLAFTRLVAGAAPADAAPCPEPPTRSRSGRAIRRRRSWRSRTRRRALLAGLNVVATIHHARGHRGVRVPGRPRRLPAVPRPLHRGQGRAAGDRGRAPDRACACCSPRRRTTTTASTWRRSWTATRSIYVGEVAARREGGAARRRAGAALSGAGRRAVRARARRGQAACGTPVAALDRGAVSRDRRRRRDRRRVRLARRAGRRPAARAGARPRGRARPRRGALRDARMVDAYLDVYRGVAAHHGARA